MSARLGLVTGRDLAQTVRAEYPRWLCYFVYVMMEIAVIGADIQEVVGSGVALKLMTGMPVWLGCLITGLDTFTFLAVQYLGVRYLEALIFLLIGTMSICFFVNWGSSDTDMGLLVRGWIVPMMPGYALSQTVGTIGAVIMPHNLYLHSGLVLSRNVQRTSPQRVYDAIWYARIESAVALLVAFLINLAIIATNAAAFFSAPCTTLENGPYACLAAKAFNASGDAQHTTPDGQGTACSRPGGGVGQCGEIGLASEGYALADALGESSLYIWALGLLAAGQASTMVCTYAGQMIMGGCLQIKLAPWKRVALTRAFALGPALLVSVATGSDTSLFNNINEYLNILQSVQLPFAMLPVLHFAASKRLLGRFASTPALFGLSCTLALVVISINVLLVVQFIQDPPALNVDEGSTSMPSYAIVLIALAGAGYFGVCIRLMWDEVAALLIFIRHLLGVPPMSTAADAGIGRVPMLTSGWRVGALPSDAQPDAIAMASVLSDTPTSTVVHT